MKFILILIAMNSAGDVTAMTTAQFESKEACLAAQSKMIHADRTMGRRPMDSYCVEGE